MHRQWVEWAQEITNAVHKELSRGCSVSQDFEDVRLVSSLA